MATIGSGASPVMRSDSHRLSKPQLLELVDDGAELRSVEAGADAEPDADAHLAVGPGRAMRRIYGSASSSVSAWPVACQLRAKPITTTARMMR